MAAILLLFPLLLSTLLISLILLFAVQRKSRRPPGPRGLPIIGNIHQLDLSKPHIWLTQLSTKYGPLISLKFCRVPVAVISSADVAKKALKHNDLAFAGRPYTSASLRLSYDHSDIISSFYTEYWRKMRKMVVHHLFSPPKLKSYRPLRQDEVRRMVEAIAKKARTNEVIDMSEALSSFNCNVLCRVAFGKKLEQGTRSWRRFDKIIGQFVATVAESFVWDCLGFGGWVNEVCGVARRFEKVFEDLDSFYQELIDEHLSPDRPDSMRDDILDLLIQLREDRTAAVKIDWNNIKAIIMNIFVGGTDTAGMTLIWAMTALMKNPNATKKVQEEIRSLGRKKTLIDEDNIEKLPYLKAVVKETLRLYPPIPLIPKETTKQCIVDGYEIQEKTFVLVNTWAIGRDPEYWENPNEFLPERFLNTSIDYKGQEFGFIPFGSGRRICVGIGLAVANMEVALANLLYFFNWEIPHGKTEEDIDTDCYIGLVLHKKSPLYLLAKSHV